MEELLKSKLSLDSAFLANAIVRLMKRDIFERFTKTGEFTEEDREFCDKISWFPIDELEVKEEYVEKLKAKSKESEGKSMSIEEFNNWCNSL